jgi:uncharacterized UBP type Zn finger protein
VVAVCQSSKEETYRHLSIDIIKDGGLSYDSAELTTLSEASVEKSLAHFFQPEVREIKCEKCDTRFTDTSHCQ